MRTILITGCLALLAGCSTSSETKQEAGLPAELKGLIGARGGDGEGALERAGYLHRNTTKTADSSLTRWRGKDGSCIEVTTTDGRYAKIAPVAASACEASDAAVPPSGNPGVLRTVCGVIVGGKTSRYLCEVEENRQGTTKMRMPDTNIELTWKPGGKVTFAQEGTSAIEAKYSESEGEMDIIVDARTFFYISNPDAAALEVKSFKPEK
jgi:hypothetical protein